MNHTSIVQGLKSHVQRAQKLAYLGHPYILGETNSIGVQGRDGETNVFGDALWVVDFSLWAAEHVCAYNPFQISIPARNQTRLTYRTLAEHPASPFPPRLRLPLRLMAAYPNQETGPDYQSPVLRPRHGCICCRFFEQHPSG